MTQFQDREFRHFCRNTKCRSKLKRPVSNKREAFCARGCHTSFYLKRCLVLRGADYSAETKPRGSAENRSAATLGGLKLGSAATPHPPSVSLASKTPGSIGSKRPPKPDRAWRQIAGPKLSASQLHCGTGRRSVKRPPKTDQKNRPDWRKHNAQALIQPHHPPVNILGGYKFPNAPDVKLREEKEPGFALTTSSTKSDDNLDIPDFLKR